MSVAGVAEDSRFGRGASERFKNLRVLIIKCLNKTVCEEGTLFGGESASTSMKQTANTRNLEARRHLQTQREPPKPAVGTAKIVVALAARRAPEIRAESIKRQLSVAN